MSHDILLVFCDRNMKHVHSTKCEKCKHFQGYHPSEKAVICHYPISEERKNKFKKTGDNNE